MRKLAIAIGIVVVLAVIVVAALPFVLDVNKYRPRIQTELEQRTGRPVSLGKMELKVFPLAFRVENAAIGEDKRFPQSRPFAQAQELFVSAKLMPLLRGDIEIGSVELVNPKIELMRNQQGVWNFASLGKAQPAAATAPTPAQSPAQPSGQTNPVPQQTTPQTTKSVTLKNLTVKDGQVAITDYQKNRPRAVYDHIDLDLEDYAANQPFSGVVAAHLPGQGKQTVEIKGKGGPLRDDNIAATDFKGTVKLDEVSLSSLQSFLNAPALEKMGFTATGTADINANNGKVNSGGELRLVNVRVNGVDVGYPIAADYQVTADMNSNLFNVQKGLIKLDTTPLSITGSVNAAPSPAQVDLKFTATNASIAEAARLAAAFGVAFNPGMQINGRLDANLTARGALDKPVLNGSAAARELVIKGKDLPQEVHVTNVDLALTPDSVRSNQFTASTGSTAVKANFALNNYASNSATIDAAVAAPNAQLGELLNIAKAYGVSAVEEMNGSGPVSLDMRVQGPIKNPSALVYSGSGRLQNASLSVPALTKPVQVKNAELRFNQNSAVLQNAAFSLGSSNASGQITVKGLAPNATPETQFALSIDKVDVAELQQMMRSTSQAQPPAKHARATTFNVIPTAEAQAKTEPASSAKTTPMLQRMVGTGNVQVGSVLYDQIQYLNAKSGVKLDHGVIRLDPFTGEVFGGTQAGTIVIDTRSPQTTYSVSSKFDHVDANKLLSAVSPVKQTLYGLLTANANTSFKASNSSDVTRTLNGTVGLNLQNGKIAHIDLLNELASIGKFNQSGKGSEPFTNVAKLTGDFKITNGVAQTDNLKAVIDGGTMAANGAINLAEQSLNLKVTAVLSKDYSQTVGGTQIGGYLNTALANSKGELVMPVLVTGTFAQPRVAPDVQRLAQMKLENLLPSTSNPGGLTTGILNGVLGGKSGTSNGQRKSGVSGILEQLGGGQSQTAAPANNNTGSATGTTNQPAQQTQPKQQPNAINDIFNAVIGQKKKAAPQQPPPEQKPPPPPPPQ